MSDGYGQRHNGYAVVVDGAAATADECCPEPCDECDPLASAPAAFLVTFSGVTFCDCHDNHPDPGSSSWKWDPAPTLNATFRLQQTAGDPCIYEYVEPSSSSALSIYDNDTCTGDARTHDPVTLTIRLHIGNPAGTVTLVVDTSLCDIFSGTDTYTSGVDNPCEETLVFVNTLACDECDTDVDYCYGTAENGSATAVAAA